MEDWFSKSFGVTAFATVQMIVFLSALGSSPEFRNNVQEASDIVATGILVAASAYSSAIFFFFFAELESNSRFPDDWGWFLIAALGQVLYLCVFHFAGYKVVRLIAAQRP